MEHECSFWIFHKPIGTCFLQAWKETTLHDNEYPSGPKYCDCYVEENHIFDDPSSSSLEKNLEDCRSLSTVTYVYSGYWLNGNMNNDFRDKCKQSSPCVQWSYQGATKKCLLFNKRSSSSFAPGFISGPKCCKEEFGTKYCPKCNVEDIQKRQLEGFGMAM